ncbi:hypothetical protein SIN8267_01817 [Sinobacterium norvegicum]|uniref:DUF2059 domain-containing protein n=1 Tax=Sinobacterium norvegicum TaxID=1641715 RepID=A0ABN8EJ78_9GAMM|nr:DUF2059 domain-containing protein [Sinobacterium norvegicum]CAH0991703.1 hypothetical protein SIN8267_01817 [Sinobacterium norvegicum]
MKKILLASLLLLTPLAYSDAATERDAENLLDVDQVSVVVEEAVLKLLDEQLQQVPDFGDYKAELRKFASDFVRFDNIKPELTQLLREAFTAQDLNDIESFISSGSGEKLLTVAGDIIESGQYSLEEMFSAEAIESYRQSFSEQELVDIEAFLSSETGQKMNEAATAIVDNNGQALMTLIFEGYMNASTES